jgi:8-oxo-dGTP pyrophosphatase MutT (NUDIX family)
VIPPWLAPVKEGAASITADQLTRFVPPPGGEARRGAVLMLWSEGDQGPELLLTERAHDMRSHPGQVSFPGGSVDPGETAVVAALREA